MAYYIPFGCVMAALALSALPAEADITYTYTGNQFNNFNDSASCPPECNISGSFTLSNPLGSNFTGYFTPNSFSFTDGINVITQTSATSFAFGMLTNSYGAIAQWNTEFY
jgi:hypothetical protein